MSAEGQRWTPKEALLRKAEYGEDSVVVDLVYHVATVFEGAPFRGEASVAPMLEALMLVAAAGAVKVGLSDEEFGDLARRMSAWHRSET